MANIPLLLDQDPPAIRAINEANIELGHGGGGVRQAASEKLPTYEEIALGGSQGSKTSPATSQAPIASTGCPSPNNSAHLWHEQRRAAGVDEHSSEDEDELFANGKKHSVSAGGGLLGRDMFSRYLNGVNETNGVAFARLSIRMGFLRKVFGILTFQLVATTLICAALYMTPHMREFVQQRSWVVFGPLFGSLGLLFAMFVHARTVPLNYFLLAGWTLLQAITIGSIVTFYELAVVIQAVVLTSVVVAGLFLYAIQTKRDFHKFYAMLYAFATTFLVATLMQIILMSPLLNFAMSVGGALLFSLFLIFDIDALMYYHSEEDYILACISIYLDITGLFLRILQILNELNRN